MRIPRSRGAISGMLLVLLGLWGALIPFVGPSFDYAYTPDRAWDYTTGRLLLEILPGAGAVLGGLLTLGSSQRLVAMFGGWLAALSGAWFVLGMPLSSVWGSATVGDPLGGTTRQAFEYVGFFGGLGAVIVFLAAFALGRFAVVGVREAARATTPAAREERLDEEPGRVEPETNGHRAGHRLHWPGSRHVGAH